MKLGNSREPSVARRGSVTESMSCGASKRPAEPFHHASTGDHTIDVHVPAPEEGHCFAIRSERR